MTTLVWVKPDQLEKAWTHLHPFIARMVETADGALTIDDAFALLKADLLQLHVALDDSGGPVAAMVTEIKQWPRLKVCALVGIVGERREDWMHHLDDIEQWARGLGCSRIRVENGRKGWLRVPRLKADYRHSVNFERDLT